MIRIIYILGAICLSLFLLDGIFGNFDSVMKNYEKVEKYFTERTIKNESTQKNVKSENVIEDENTQIYLMMVKFFSLSFSFVLALHLVKDLVRTMSNGG